MIAASASGCCKSGADTTALDEVCPGKYSGLTLFQRSGQATCSCAAGAATGSVWGSDIYTTDSSICGAAVHAGVIPASGGKVTVSSAPGCQTYAGTTRNGITTSDWWPYKDSFYFAGKGDGKCPAPKPAATSAPATGDMCPTHFKEVPGLSATTELTCKCDTVRIVGPVWGTDIYTQDSSVCRAAVHAGEIPATGGTVKAKAAPGCKKYTATNRNGVASSSWGQYDNSFYFPNKGSGTCAR